MTPRASTTAKDREELHQRLDAAKAERARQLEQADRLRTAAEAAFWRSVARALDGAYHGSRNDAAASLGYTRDHILKKTKQHR
ncbi:hypothetical protein ABT390_33955 [Streptomyces aurantiacus]|uniref:DNA binding HTH domain-containing protein n=1 Tax=Streptomyces aurantiacus JA 4570 TaxID=1286094 RepID=S4AZV1_9ACTN|nr:hypothetical protein [Streptomyces aurantiacus]EPH46877.1 hypothetical protein STRAU_0043 [Streptomyces aurantiacus JA 4570]